MESQIYKILNGNSVMELNKITDKLNMLGLEVVIGLETHIRLNTMTKLFCSCANDESELPNSNICPVCTGQMGVLPAVNKEAVRKAIYFGKAVNSSMKNEIIHWDRKHYEYPDLPKNFQLTQFHKPVITDGKVECYRNDGTNFSVELEQVHIEEDAAKLVHERNITLVDFNKAGVPLIEVVTKPCIHGIEDVSVYAQYLQRIVRDLKISEANMEKSEFKSDVSVSLRRKGINELNPRAEIKNLNSFRFMMEAIVEEVTKQLDYYIEHGSPRPDQTTVLFDADLKETRTMRKKEFAADYRFAQEPDIPMINIKTAIEEIVVESSLLPFSVETILIEGGVLPRDAKFFTSDPLRSKVFLSINKKVSDPQFVAKTLTNNLKPEEYEKIINLGGFSEIFLLLKEEKITLSLSQQYDLVLNGYEIGGGSVRAHKTEILEATYRNMGYDREAMKKSVGHMLNAFQYGAPPHGGIAWGVDRLVMILEKKSSIREVIAFPKTGNGEDLMFGSPSALHDKKIMEANIKVLSQSANLIYY